MIQPKDKTPWQIRYLNDAEAFLKQAGKDSTNWGRHVLKLLAGPAKRAEKRLARPKPTTSQKEYQDARDAADEAFQLFVRWRDTDGGDHLSLRVGICVTCRNRRRGDELQCGHWIPRENHATRYHPFNSHAQCRHCNSKEFGNGRMDDHERMIPLIHRDPSLPNKLRALVKFNNKHKSILELKEIAKDFGEQLAQIKEAV